MISDEELEQLPENPDLAFVGFERIMRARVDEQERQELRLAEEGVGFSADSYRREYINKVLAAARVYGIAALESWRIPSVQDDIMGSYIAFTSEVDNFTTQVRLRNAPRNRQNSVGLDGTIKVKIHHYIGQIRAAIEKADLPEPKRDSLYTKLNSFALEVDKNRTNLQSGMAIYIAVCDGIGQGFQKLEPARKLIDSIGTLLGRAKEVEDNFRPALSRPGERKQLEAPRARLASPEPKRDNLDGEIPF
jgi:hypothetical protein